MGEITGHTYDTLHTQKDQDRESERELYLEFCIGARFEALPYVLNIHSVVRLTCRIVSDGYNIMVYKHHDSKVSK